MGTGRQGGHFPPHHPPRRALCRPAPQRCLCPGEPPAEGASLEGRGLHLDREVTGAPGLLADPAGTVSSLYRRETEVLRGEGPSVQYPAVSQGRTPGSCLPMASGHRDGWKSKQLTSHVVVGEGGPRVGGHGRAGQFIPQRDALWPNLN